MVESIGFCEKHELPLDPHGECELCRLSAIPSQVPRARSPWWLVIIPLALFFAWLAWALSPSGSEPDSEPQRGVQAPTPRRADPPPATAETRPREPASTPPPIPSDAPIPSELPTAEDVPPKEDPLVPEPEAPRDEQSAAPLAPTEADAPDWKWELARRRVSITMYATQWCGVCRQARTFMQENDIDFTERDIEGSPAARDRLGELNPKRTIPTFQIDDLVYVGFQAGAFESTIDEAARKHL